ncbi:MAG: hypothetical protein AB7O44_23340 [Hyphomicrobiaceae bacterium]
MESLWKETANAASEHGRAELERALGLQSFLVMSIETLNTAARAAGFAMAAPEGPDVDGTLDKAASGTRQPGEAVLLHQSEDLNPPEAPTKLSIGEWVRGVLALGRGAPA